MYPRATAMATASDRLCAFRVFLATDTCHFTVGTEILNRLAISFVVAPAATNPSTSRCRGVSDVLVERTSPKNRQTQPNHRCLIQCISRAGQR